MKDVLALFILYITFKSVISGCTNDTTTDFQLTASGYYVETNVECVSVCNSYSPPGVFFYAFFLEKEICFCRNASLAQLNISSFNDPCVTSTCLRDNNGSDCFLSSYEVLPLSLGIVEWEINVSPNVKLVDKEVLVQTNILRGDASTAVVTPIPNDLPSAVQTVTPLAVKRFFYLPGLQEWSQEIRNNFTVPFNATTWIQIDEEVGGIDVVSSTVVVDGFYNFFLIITQGTNVSVTLSLPSNQHLNFTADVIRLTYGFDPSLFYTTSLEVCNVNGGFILRAFLTSGRFTNLKLKVNATGALKIAFLRPICSSSTTFCPSLMNCTSTCFTKDLVGNKSIEQKSSTVIKALVVKSFMFQLNNVGIIEIPVQNIDNEVQENDMVWVGGSGSLFCRKDFAKLGKVTDLGTTITFSSEDIQPNDVYITFFITKPFEYLIQIPASTVGLYNISVEASNHVPSSQQRNYSFLFQIPVSGLRFAEMNPYPKNIGGYKLNTWMTLKAVIDNGSDVMYMFDIPKLNFSKNISNGDTIDCKVTSLGVFTVYLTAANKFSSLNTSIDVVVLSEIKGLSVNVQKNQLIDRSFNTSVKITNGTSIQLIVDFGDGTPVKNETIDDANGVNGFTYTLSHKYSVCKTYTILTSVDNVPSIIGAISKPSFFSSTNVTVFCILSPLKVVTNPSASLSGFVMLSLNKMLIVDVNQDTGSFMNYSVDWGDGFFSSNDQSLNLKPVSFPVSHLYNNERNYTVSITSKNLLEIQSYLIQVQVKNCSVPEISFYYGSLSSPFTVILSIGKELTAVVAKVDQFCEMESSSFQWNLTSSTSKPQISQGTQINQKVAYTIEANSLDVGLYNLSLTFIYGAVTNVYFAYLDVTFSPLYMDIESGSMAIVAYKKQNGNHSFHQNFTVSAKSSYDPDDPSIGIEKINFAWQCKVASNFSYAQDVMMQFKNLNMTYAGDTCFNQTWINLNLNTPEVRFGTQQFLEGVSYHIEVCGTKFIKKDQSKTGCFTQELQIVAGNLPTVAVRCISNCDIKLNFKDRVIYSYECADCGAQRLVAEWSITDDDGKKPPEIYSQNATTTGFSTPSLVINNDILIEMKSYTFRLEVGFADSIKKVKFLFKKSTCSHPVPGVCYINPTEGFALETKFKLICKDWTDSEGMLSYRFYYNNGQPQRMKLSSTTNIDFPILNAATTDQPSLIDFMMGPGDKENDYKINILIKVSGKYKAYTEFNSLYIKVFPNVKAVNVTDLLTGISLNDTQSVANLVQAVSSTTNKESSKFFNSTPPPVNRLTGMIDNEKLDQEKQQALTRLQDSRTQVVRLLDQVPLKDLNSFKIVGDALGLSSQNPHELVPQTQSMATNVIVKMAGLLTKENLKTIGADHFDTMTQPFVNTISNLFMASVNNTEKGFVNPTVQTTPSSNVVKENAELMSKLFKSMDDYFFAAQSYKVPSENATVGQTNHFNFVLRKEYPSSLSNDSIGSSEKGESDEYGFTLPDSNNLFNKTILDSQILISNVRMKVMAYTWDTNRSQNILSESQSLSFQSPDRRTIKVNDSLKPIHIAIKNIPEKMNGKNISLSMPEDVYQVRLPITLKCNMLLKFVHRNDQKNLTNLIVYIQFGKVASKDDYDIKLNISAKDGVIMTKNYGFFNSSLKQKSNLNVANSVLQTSGNSSELLQRNQDARLLTDGTLVLWNFHNSTYAFSNKSELHLSFSYFGPMPDKKLDSNPYTFDEPEYAGTFDYEMKSFCTECNYWDEDANKWMSDGCELDVQTTSFAVTKCKCNHLTAFGGFFVAPNPLPTPSLALLKSGYALLVTVAIIILLWILGLIVARRIDKKDFSKIGVCPLLDNLAGDSYLYQITVNTGSQRNAGTKSNIFFTITGNLDDSGVRRLKGSQRECFQRSSCDVFIMTTSSSLGDLDFIRLWHDNSGGGWYIRNIEVIDLQTEKQFLFIGHRWIAVDRDSCLLDCVIPVAASEEKSNFNYVFATKVSTDLSDQHIWYSIFARPPKSNFTRCQRLSVAVSLLMTAMTASTMFYQRMPPPDPKVDNKIANFSFTWGQAYVALISACITIPVNLILVGLFRSIRPFQIPTKSKSESISSVNESKEVQRRSSSPVHLLENSDPNQKATHILIDHHDNSKDPSAIKTTKCFNLPHWCLYIAWFICVGIIFGCGYIVLLYGMSFGNAKSLSWLSSISLCLIKDILLIQPIKIFFLAIFVALIIKNVDEEKSEVEKQGKVLARDETWLHKPKDELTIFDRVDIDLQPPDSTSLTGMRELRLKKLKMHAIIQELALYTFYAFLVFFIGYMTREDFTFYQTRNVEELFNLRLRTDKTKPDDNYKIFSKLQSSQDFWPWMDQFFLPQVYPEPWYNLSDFYSNTDKKDFPGKLFLNDLTSKIVNGIRIRQVRVQPHSCVKAESVAKYFKIDCLSPYEMTLEETRDFDFNWTIPKKYSSPINPSTMPWRYQTWQELDGYPYTADLDSYYGGGYVIEIFPKWKNQMILEQAKKFRWIDRQTRAVIIEFALFNSATNHFNMVTMIFEFPASGGIIPNFSVITFKMYTTTSGTEIAMLGSQVLFILMMLVFSIRECRFLYRTGWVYFKEFWNLVEVALIVFSIVAVGFFFYKNVLAKELLKRLPTKKPQGFINFQFASYWDLTYTYIVSLIVFFVTLKFIKLLRFNRRISMLSSTLKAAWYPLSMFGIVFFIILCSIVFSSSIVFGVLLDGYQNYFKTIASIISLLLGKFSYSQFENTNRFLGPIFFFGFNIMVNWIVMNMFISILNDVFAVVRANLEFQDNDYEMVDFMMESFKDWIGLSSPKQIEVQLPNQNRSSIDSKSNSNDRPSLTFLRKTNLRKNEREKERFFTEFNEKQVAGENQTLYTLESKDTLIDKKFSKYDYLLKEQELSTGINETLDKFIECMNLLYFDDVTVAKRMNEVVKKEIEKV